VIRGEIFFATLLLIFVSYLFYEAANYPLITAKLFPILLIIIAYPLLLILFIRNVRRTIKEERQSGKDGRNWLQESIPLINFLLLLVSVYLAGFYLGFLIFLLVFFKYYRYPLRVSLLLISLTMLITYLFSLAYPLWNGIVFH